MSKFLTIFLIIVSLAYVTSRRALGEDCDSFHWCDKGLDCFDYRCQIATPDVEDGQVKFGKKEGNKCNWFHHCGKGLKCKKHRCQKKN